MRKARWRVYRHECALLLGESPGKGSRWYCDGDQFMEVAHNGIRYGVSRLRVLYVLMKPGVRVSPCGQQFLDVQKEV